MATRPRNKNVLPGFGLTLGFTLAYLGIVVLIPISTIFFKTFTLTWPQFWAAVASPRTIAAYKLSFGASIAGALINSVFGFVVAWSRVRYEFPGKTLIDVMVDLPFALPTSVAGITLTAIYAGNGWIGRYLAPLAITTDRATACSPLASRSRKRSSFKTLSAPKLIASSGMANWTPNFCAWL